MPAEEYRIGNAHQRIVDLKIKEMLNPHSADFVEPTLPRQRCQTTTMPVWCREDAARAFQQHPSGGTVEGRHFRLTEKQNVGFFEPEIIVTGEKSPSCGIGCPTGHDQEWWRAPETAAKFQNFLGMNLIKRGAGYGPYRKTALGKVGTQSAALATCHKNHRNQSIA